MYLFNGRIKVLKGFSQSTVKCIDRTVSLADHMLGNAVNCKFYRCLGDRFTGWKSLHIYVIFNKLKGRLICAHYFFDHEVKTGISRFELIAFVLEVLNSQQYLTGQLFVLCDLCFFQLCKDV